jgi:hypothetical protein
MVGQSGKAEFPHVHFHVRHDGRVVDPFVGVEATEPCEATAASLWRPDLMDILKYRPFTIYNAGFAAGRPDLIRIRNGRHDDAQLRTTSPAMTVWVEAFGVREGDQVLYRIIRPDGESVHERRVTIAKKYARWFGFSGLRNAVSWPRGLYIGEITITRPNSDGPLTRAVRIEAQIQ